MIDHFGGVDGEYQLTGDDRALIKRLAGTSLWSEAELAAARRALGDEAPEHVEWVLTTVAQAPPPPIPHSGIGDVAKPE